MESNSGISWTELLGFDLALLQESESLLVKLVLITGVPTTLESLFLLFRVCCITNRLHVAVRP